MKIEMEIEEKHPRQTMLPAVFSAIAGDAGWVKMEIDGRVYEFDRRDFNSLARALESFDERR